MADRGDHPGGDRDGVAATRLVKWGQMIADLRTEQKVSRPALSRMSGVPANTIANIENAKTSSSITTVERLLIVLGYELDAIPIREGFGRRLLLLTGQK